MPISARPSPPTPSSTSPPPEAHAGERKRRIPTQLRSQTRGLLLLALAALVFAILRAGVGRAFNPGWWRLW